MEYQNLNRKAVYLNKEQLEEHLEKLASDHILQDTSSKETYPISKVKEDFAIIEEVYHLLNEHIKLGIPIHPAGEWLLDNFYIIEEAYKTILQEMPLKKYKKFLGIASGSEKGFARIYVLAYEIVNYTDNHIDYHNVSNLLASYQRKKTLSMEEIWNIGIFMEIALIQNIKDICEKIYFSQMQKYRVENILERLVEKKEELKYKNLSEYKAKVKGYGEMKYPFIEYLSYRLKKQGKASYPFMEALEEQVNKMGTTIEEVIKKEHFDIALKKVSMANCITSIKELLHMDFLSIFEESNSVEEILKQDPAKVYCKMDYRTKEQYRNAIKQMAKKTKIAEVYIAQKALELAQKEKKEEITKKSHIGYYLISQGKQTLYEIVKGKESKVMSKETKISLYIGSILGATLLLDVICMMAMQNQIKNVVITILLGIMLLFPLQEIVVQLWQYILGKVVKPKPIPKMNFYDGVPKECATFIVIPTILKSKEKVAELMNKLEVYYLANKSENLYFALLGDCSSGQNKEEPYDKEVIKEGLHQVEKLNKKYQNSEQIEEMPKFNFIYRKRYWNGQEECYLGWERKRGLLNQFNDYLLGKQENPFLVNTIETYWKMRQKDQKGQIPQKETSPMGMPPMGMGIKYIITLDADTELVLNTGLELIGSMAHILNKPKLNEKGDCVIEGHALMQPRIGITLESANKNLFTRIFAGTGGVDSYTNAISDVYQDNFDEGIFTGKGIYDLQVFSDVLENEIPENMVLSHDLLEGCYLRCGLVSDIVLMDGYPTSYASFKARLHRWIRGDFQIIKWAGKRIINKKQREKENPLGTLCRYKIMDNLIRAMTPIFTLLSFLFLYAIAIFKEASIGGIVSVIMIAILMPTILNVINHIVYRKEGQSYQKTFAPRIPSLLASFYRGMLALMTLPDKAYYSADAIIRTIYRLTVSKKHLLEWITSEDAEKLAKSDLVSYYANMLPNMIVGIIGIIYSIVFGLKMITVFLFALSLLWLIAPAVLYFISKKEKQTEVTEGLNAKEQEYLQEIGKKTWQFFKDSIIAENHYLPPDNYQEDRKPNFVNRTSSTNIGLGLLGVISAYDLEYENLEDTLKLLNQMVLTIDMLPKWHGHLYNWYNIKTLEPLMPRYVSTVDSGNFIGYVYVLKSFYEEIKEKLETKEIEVEEEKRQEYLNLIPSWVSRPISEVPMANADFTKLYEEERQLFSIGFNIEENKLTPSYYDLLASEARQASFIAISKKDVPAKHWNRLSRTLTTMNGYNGLVSWSGTAFEYLMPNIIMKNEKGSLLDESCQFMLMGQKAYAKKLGIPWGFSETAFYLKDLNNNYQYKAIGIPWLGLKRGLEEDMVVASYGSIMALNQKPKEVVQNLKKLEEEGMVNQYGFYESIDYTPIRMPKGKKEMVVKTYMAHHQALILLSINNFFHEQILQRRFSANPEISAVEILLQETMPEKRIITKEEKIKPEKIVYQDYENYAQRTYKKTKEELPICNVLANENYSIVMDQKGRGYSKYKNYLVNRYQVASDETQGIFFYLKNIKNKRIWTSNDMNYLAKADSYEIVFTEDSNKIKRRDGSIESICKVTIGSEKPVEIRRLELTNHGMEEEMIEITTAIEPALASLEQYGSHPAFQNLFVTYEYLEEDNLFIIKRKDRANTEKGVYLAISFYTEDATIGELEYEVDREKFQGRGNLGLPVMVEQSRPFSKKIQFITEPILALRRTVSLKPEQKVCLNLLFSVSEEREEAIQNVKEYQREEAIKKSFELAIARADTEARYLRLKAKQIETYQKMLGYILFSNPMERKEKLTNSDYPKEDLWQYGISGDLPILLVKIRDSSEIEILEEVLKAYEFFRLKNVEMDVVIINEEPNSYEKYTKEAIQNSILNANLGYLQNIRGGIFVLENDLPEAIAFYAKFTIDTKKGPITRQLKDLEEEYLESIKPIGEKVPTKIQLEIDQNKAKNIWKQENLLYENEYGGFSENGKEYQIKISKENRLPTVWSHMMANEKFGSLVTDSMGGFTWSQNSGLNKITSWSNNQVVDNPSEVIYLQEQDTLKTWSIGLNPMPDKEEYQVTYGFGYACYKHESQELSQEVTVFVAKENAVKISLLDLKNLEAKKKKLNLYYYVKPVLGENEIRTNGYLDLTWQENSNLLVIQNKTNTDFKQMAYIASSEKIKSYTGNKKFFFGEGNLANPKGMKKVVLDNENSLGKDPIAVVQIEIELEAFERKQMTLLLGVENNLIECQDKVYQYTKIEKVESELEQVKNEWNNTLEKVQITTPLSSFNILMNGWLVYQTITSRLRARSGFYQSGGAFGFRDQLQDTLGLKYLDVNIMKNQIIKHSKHQFIEGDVEHWWHEETKRGIRTKFSDDLLWLVYMVEEYINFTGDMSILEIETPYVQGELLEEGTDEKYDIYLESQIKESIFMHCERAIQKSLNFGENGLPKIGSGDWNDGLSKVGSKGKGESVWLGFFLYDILQKWIKILETLPTPPNETTNEPENELENKPENEAENEAVGATSSRPPLEGIPQTTQEPTNLQQKITNYQQISEELKKSLNTNAWDGRWYKRAFMDDGSVLGTLQNEECKIDGIAQSWSVISKAGDNDKKYISLESLENHLVDKENGIIKLLDPPFEKSKLEPGYIKAYLPGTRENGGQYTHAAIWAIIAEAMLGFGDKSLELFRMINPIEHARTKEAAQKYKVEPYVVAADIYGQGNLAGRGGWTWYTGSSSWMYEAGLHYILGLTIEKGYLSINPCIPSDWKEYKIHYKFQNSIYNIHVKNPNQKNTGIEKMLFNKTEIQEKKIKLDSNGQINELEIII